MLDATSPHVSSKEAPTDASRQFDVGADSKSDGTVSNDLDDPTTALGDETTVVTQSFLEEHWLRGIGED